MSIESGVKQPDGSRSRRAPCAGDANALRAISLLSRWNRAARLRLMFGGSCACCVGDGQLAHLERQLVDYLYQRHRSIPALELLLRDCAPVNAGEPGAASSPVSKMMRLIATERSEPSAADHAHLLSDLEEVIQSLE